MNFLAVPYSKLIANDGKHNFSFDAAKGYQWCVGDERDRGKEREREIEFKCILHLDLLLLPWNKWMKWQKENDESEFPVFGIQTSKLYACRRPMESTDEATD